MPMAGGWLPAPPAYDAITAWGIGVFAVVMAVVAFAVAARWRAARAGTAALAIAA